MAVIAAVAAQVGGDVAFSAWRITGQILAWWVAIVAGFQVQRSVPRIVALGVTRKELTVANGVFGGLFALALAGVMTVGLLIERSVYEAFGWSYALEGPLFADAGAAAVIAGLLLWYVAIYAVCFAVGAFFGIAAYRDHRWTAFIGAPMAIAAVLLTGLVSLEFAEVRLQVADWPDAVWVVALSAFAAMAAVLGALQLRGIPILAKRV
jgi:hypothetical protein